MRTQEAVPGTYHACAETLLDLDRRTEGICRPRTHARDKLLTLALSHELSRAEPGNLAIGVRQSWIHGILHARIVSIGTLPGGPEHDPIMRHRRLMHIVEMAERDYGIRTAGKAVVASVNTAYGEPVWLTRCRGVRRRPRLQPGR